MKRPASRLSTALAFAVITLGVSCGGTTTGGADAGEAGGAAGAGGSGGSAGSSGAGGSGGSFDAGTDATVDSGKPCTTTSDCGAQEMCGFPESDACNAKGACFAVLPVGCNGYSPGCACDGSTINVVCTGLSPGYTTAPLAHPGQCTADDAGCSGYVDVVADNGAPQHFGSICAGSWGTNQTTSAVGYLFSGGPAPGVQRLEIAGCASSSAVSTTPGISLSASDASSVGTYTVGTTSYTDAAGTWGFANDPFHLVVTRLDAAGGVIEGSFTAMVTHGGNAARSLTGSFHVCRVPDELAP